MPAVRSLCPTSWLPFAERLSRCEPCILGDHTRRSFPDHVDHGNDEVAGGWRRSGIDSDGKPATAHTQKRTVHGLPATTIDVTGKYSGMGDPMATAKTSKPGYRLLGAIIEKPWWKCVPE